MRWQWRLRRRLDPVALYAGSRNGVVTIEATFGVDDQTAGSGFVVNARRGLIVTASHVVTDAKPGSTTATEATAVYIVLDDGTRADVRVLGYDLFEDTALLQVDPAHLGLRALPLGRARSLRVGDPVAVIGSPFENRASLSTGVVSQLDRQIAAPGVCFRRPASSRRTPPSTRATRAGRCSTPAERSSAWSRRSTRTHAAVSPTPCQWRRCERPTWRWPAGGTSTTPGWASRRRR